MLSSPDVISRFNPAVVDEIASEVASAGKLLLTGEGSSRIFPAKNAIAQALRNGDALRVHTDASRQAAEYNLDGWAVLGVSNSGRTAEVIRLMTSLKEKGFPHRYSLTAHAGSTLESLATAAFTLTCGGESAVAATKSVLEQALFERALVDAVAKRPLHADRLAELSDAVANALTTEIPSEVTDRIASAGTIYWAGRNDGVVEELTLKTNEITRKKSDFLEGTYAVHGIEEVMDKNDVVIWIDPYQESESKFEQVLASGVGMKVICVSSRPTAFETIRVDDAGDLNGFVQMAAGWNILVEVGLKLGIDLDKPQRARKVGNEFTG
jgi:glucosamine--fructose-6-phosphate aminotransferase (isomerizing)